MICGTINLRVKDVDLGRERRGYVKRGRGNYFNGKCRSTSKRIVRVVARDGSVRIRVDSSVFRCLLGKVEI